MDPQILDLVVALLEGRELTAQEQKVLAQYEIALPARPVSQEVEFELATDTGGFFYKAFKRHRKP